MVRARTCTLGPLIPRRGKPFAQYSTVLPDGRFVVEVRVFDPFLVTVVLVATSGRGALEQVRALGGRDVHVSKDFRPDHEAVAALISGEPRGVFAPAPSDGTWLPLTELPAFLDGTSRHLARYDVRAFDRSWARFAGDARRPSDTVSAGWMPSAGAGRRIGAHGQVLAVEVRRA